MYKLYIRRSKKVKLRKQLCVYEQEKSFQLFFLMLAKQLYSGQRETIAGVVAIVCAFSHYIYTKDLFHLDPFCSLIFLPIAQALSFYYTVWLKKLYFSHFVISIFFKYSRFKLLQHSIPTSLFSLSLPLPFPSPLASLCLPLFLIITCRVLPLFTVDLSVSVNSLLSALIESVFKFKKKQSASYYLCRCNGCTPTRPLSSISMEMSCMRQSQRQRTSRQPKKSGKTDEEQKKERERGSSNELHIDWNSKWCFIQSPQHAYCGWFTVEKVKCQ